MIKLVPRFSIKQIAKDLLVKKQRINDAILLNLQRIGEQLVINARNTDSYKDRTGNLRGSIGYVILYNGKQLNADIEGTVEGVRFAKKAIADAKQNFPNGFVLICVAGMEYALAVESKGFDVLTSSAEIASKELKIAMNRIKRKLNKAA